MGTTNNIDYKIYKVNKTAKCLPYCPPNYKPKQSNPHLCEPCKGSCVRSKLLFTTFLKHPFESLFHLLSIITDCSGNHVINSVAALQEIKGCSEITGALEISLSGRSKF